MRTLIGSGHNGYLVYLAYQIVKYHLLLLGRGHNGYLVYLAYQLVESVTFAQVT